MIFFGSKVWSTPRFFKQKSEQLAAVNNGPHPTSSMDLAAGEPAAALTLQQTSQLLMACGVMGVAAYLLILVSYVMMPNIKAQHPAAGLVIWQVGCGIMTSLGFVAAFFVEVRWCLG